ncbi:MAG: stage II sporulation protein P [Chitinophagales bacterium]
MVKVLLVVLSAIIMMAAAPGLDLRVMSTVRERAESRAKIVVGLWVISPQAAETLVASNLPGFGTNSISAVSITDLIRITGFEINEPFTVMASIIKPLDLVNDTAIATVENQVSLDTVSDDEEQPTDVIDGPPIAIYCTHNAESYYPDAHTSRAQDGKGLINGVAAYLAQSMRKKGFDAVFDGTLHDTPDYNMSYVNSRKTIQQFMEEDESWAAILDIHRDSIPNKKKPEVVTIDGKKTARILLVVGTNQRRPNPYWNQNLDFANHLQDVAQQMYPGLIEGVRMKPGTYNQDLYTPSVLVEVGNDYNSLDEAKRGVTCFADVLTQVLMEGKTDADATAQD